MKYLIGLMLIVYNVGQAAMPSDEALKTVYVTAKEYDIDAQLLIRIAAVESHFRVNAKRLNTNGTVDVGMFQINSVHWTTTCKKFDVFTLKGNARCAATLVKQAMKYKDTDSQWVGRYHSKTPSKKRKYTKLLSQIDVSKYERE